MLTDEVVDALRGEVERRCRSFPEVTVEGGGHLGFVVRGRRFAWFLADHHGDGRVGVDLKAAPGVQAALVGAVPHRFYVPSYLGAKGWLGVRLDDDEVDWEEVGDLLLDAYRLVAPKRLAARAVAPG